MEITNEIKIQVIKELAHVDADQYACLVGEWLHTAGGGIYAPLTGLYSATVVGYIWIQAQNTPHSPTIVWNRK